MPFKETEHFKLAEFRCPCCGRISLKENLLPCLEKVRRIFKAPMCITSGFRCQAHNTDVGGGPEHPSGMAADIGLHDGWEVYALVKAAIEADIPRIGINSKKNANGRYEFFVHLGISRDLPPGIWTY
jgi:hypothetical protein